MTSVKNFRVDEPATLESLGQGSFIFTDDYSVFDWGKMPDEIPQKGASLCTMGAFNFELLEEADVPTHYLGVRNNGETLHLRDALKSDPPNEMAITLTQSPDLPFNVGDGYDYEAYHEAGGENYLIPLEIVFRNRIGVGSSLRRRTDPQDHGIEFESWPDEAVELDEPIVEFSTKYEEQDRYLERTEADRIAGKANLKELDELARDVNQLITEQAKQAGMVHQDGKIECLYFDGEVRVADVVGTFDENRFSYASQQVSKEVLRQYHKRTQPEWVEAVNTAKDKADEKGLADWKALCDIDPEPLDQEIIDAARNLYCAGTNAYTDQSIFAAPSLDAAVDALRHL